MLWILSVIDVFSVTSEDNYIRTSGA